MLMITKFKLVRSVRKMTKEQLLKCLFSEWSLDQMTTAKAEQRTNKETNEDTVKQNTTKILHTAPLSPEQAAVIEFREQQLQLHNSTLVVVTPKLSGLFT